MKKLTAIIVSTLFVVSLAIPFAAFAGDPMSKSKASASGKKMSGASEKGKMDSSGKAKKTASATDEGQATAKKKDAAGSKTPQKKGK